MARKSNEARARALGDKLGVELTEEHLGQDEPTIEVWSMESSLSEPQSYCHTYFARGETWPKAWADAIQYLKELKPCPDDCDCWEEK